MSTPTDYDNLGMYNAILKPTPKKLYRDVLKNINKSKQNSKNIQVTHKEKNIRKANNNKTTEKRNIK